MATDRVVYHYTHTARLPWILTTGELRPGANRIGGFPDPDFLWATTSALGDRTASASMPALRAGLVRHVRFVLPAEAFETWPEILSAFPAWTPDHVGILERAAKGLSRPQDWRCRADPLPLGAWLGIETRSYFEEGWRPLDPPWRIMPFDENSLGVQIGTKVYVSKRFEKSNGPVSYVPVVLDAEEAA